MALVQFSLMLHNTANGATNMSKEEQTKKRLWLSIAILCTNSAAVMTVVWGGEAITKSSWLKWSRDKVRISGYESRRLSDVPTCFLGLTIFSRASCRPLSLWSYVHACCSGSRCNSQNV